MHAFLSNLANRQTDRQTDKRGEKHLPPPLSEVIKAVQTDHTINERTVLEVTQVTKKYNQNRRFRTQFETVEGSQCEPRLNFSSNTKTLSLEQSCKCTDMQDHVINADHF